MVTVGVTCATSLHGYTIGDMESPTSYLSDSAYRQNYSIVSTSSLCDDSECWCDGSGRCVSMLFNHFMHIDEDILDYKTDRYVPLNTSVYKFPIKVDSSTADELSVEEVGASIETLGPSYEYFMRQVPLPSEDPGLVSVNIYDYKSVCFNIASVLAAVRDSDVPDGAISLLDAGNDHSWVLCIDNMIQQRISEALCEVGASPIVKPPTYFGVVPAGFDETHSMDLVVLGISALNDGTIPTVGDIHSKVWCDVYCKSCDGVRAVRTAVVTLSITLKPVSMYGGVRPSTKQISYVIHNVIL